MEDKFINPVRDQRDSGEQQKKQISNGVKLTSAVYRLLDFFPEGEPLKNRAKDKVLSISENLILVFGTQGWASLQRDKAANQLLVDIEIIMSYLKLAKSFSWIDNVNFLIISKEYEKIKNQIGFTFEKLPVEPIKNIAIENQISFTEGKISQPKTLGRSPTGEAPEFLISDRQKKIIQILTEKGRAQVSDFKLVLGNITKRTIRRDLDELLKNRKIIRAGEWNKVFYEIGQY